MKRSHFLRSLLGLAAVPAIASELKAEKPVTGKDLDFNIRRYAPLDIKDKPFEMGQIVAENQTGNLAKVVNSWGITNIDNGTTSCGYTLQPCLKSVDIGWGPGARTQFSMEEAHKRFSPAFTTSEEFPVGAYVIHKNDGSPMKVIGKGPGYYYFSFLRKVSEPEDKLVGAPKVWMSHAKDEFRIASLKELEGYRP